jgi:hypothetical protein
VDGIVRGNDVPGHDDRAVRGDRERLVEPVIDVGDDVA